MISYLYRLVQVKRWKGSPPPIGECEIDKKERDALEEEMRKIGECDMEEYCRLECSEKTIAILGDRWWPQTTKQDGDRISKQFSI